MRIWPGLLLLLACTPAKTPTADRTAAPAAAATASASPHRPAASGPAVAPEASPSDDEVCQDDGFDFAYRIDEYNGRREVVCGVGPGTACTDERMDYCSGTKLLTCIYGKMSMTNCREYCREVGDPNGVTYDGGMCTQKDADKVCVCCDAGEPGCEKERPQPQRRYGGSHGLTTPRIAR